MFGRKTIISVVCACVVQGALAKESRLTRESLPIKHALFEQWQGNHAAAYRVAEYYKLRHLDAPELRLVQASASLEMGYLAHGRELIKDLDERSLLPENQSRLHLYLARDAYRRRDWPLLDEQLDALVSFNPDNRHYYFLKAEAARVAGRVPVAEQWIANLDRNDVLSFYGLFNLATSVVDVNHDASGAGFGDENKNKESDQAATRLLQALIDLPPRDYEQRMLAERARIALADIYVNAGERESARRTLARVTASEQYGPLALARLAKLDMQDEQYENAASIWQYLLEQYPWHRAATAAPSGLGYALLKAQGEEAAYGAYLTALGRIQQQQLRLQDFRQTLRASLLDSDWGLDESAANETLLTKLSEGLGHDDWTSWLSEESVRKTARRWQSLNDAYFQLQTRQQDLDVLLEVDAEQQRRVLSAQEAISDEGLDRSARELQQRISREISFLRNQKLDITGPIERLANPDELALLEEFAVLRKSPAAPQYQARLDRLVGLVRFEIHDSIPVRKQQQIAGLEQQLQDVELATSRVQRIQLAAQRLATTNSVSGQISILAGDTQALALRTKLALGFAEEALIAGLTEFVDRDEALLANQVHGLQYDITRLVDRQVAEVQP